MTEIDNAIAIAQQIKNAVVGKFPKYEGFVRRFATTEDQPGYIQIALRPVGGSTAQEKAVAYSDEFFTSITAENKKEKAKIIYDDFKQLIVLP